MAPSRWHRFAARLRPRFRLRTLLIVVALAALALAPLGRVGNDYRREQAALMKMTDGSFSVIHDRRFM